MKSKRPQPASPAPESPAPDPDAAVTTDDVLVVRRGPGANCSSIGSALDILFLSAVAGGALLAGIAAAFPEGLARARGPADLPPPTPPAPAAAADDPEDPDARAT